MQISKSPITSGYGDNDPCSWMNYVRSFTRAARSTLLYYSAGVLVNNKKNKNIPHSRNRSQKHTTLSEQIPTTYHTLGTDPNNIPHSRNRSQKHTTLSEQIPTIYHTLGTDPNNIPHSRNRSQKHTTLSEQIPTI